MWLLPEPVGPTMAIRLTWALSPAFSNILSAWRGVSLRSEWCDRNLYLVREMCRGLPDGEGSPPVNNVTKNLGM
ncbi:hypothetical protein EDC04DRAFT_2770360 [Pisolithus marmoratus]|nr:hypothetical protein EDC04DRAFT_2770360 [Pisolithus marmoratus]